MKCENFCTGALLTLLVTFASCVEPKRDRIIVRTVAGETETEIKTKTDGDDDDDDRRPPPDTTPPVDRAPAIERIEVLEAPDVLEIRVITEPGDAPLDGGTLEIDLGGAFYALAIPDDLFSFDGSVLSFLAERRQVGGCTKEDSYDLVVEVIDASSRTSGSFLQPIEADPIGIVVSEVGYFYASIIGTVSSPTTVCGTLTSTGYSGTQYTGDLDFTLFQVDTTDTWTVQLDWGVTGDWDLYLYEEQANGDLLEIDSSHGPETHGPEAVTLNLNSARTYVFEVAGWSGSPSDWTVEIH